MDIREKKCYSKVVFGEADEIPLEISESSCRRRRPYNFDYSVDYANMPSSSKVQRIFGDGFEQDQMVLSVLFLVKSDITETKYVCLGNILIILKVL